MKMLTKLQEEAVAVGWKRLEAAESGDCEMYMHIHAHGFVCKCVPQKLMVHHGISHCQQAKRVSNYE